MQLGKTTVSVLHDAQLLLNKQQQILVASIYSGQPKFGFGYSAKCGQLCIFGQYSASAECENYFSAKLSASAILYSALAESDSTTVFIYYIHCNLVYNAHSGSQAK